MLLSLLLLAPALASPVLDQAVPIEDPQLLAPWFQALDAAAAGEGVARALHYGDSTIAYDGIAKTVRARLQARFGDAGPGFVSASFHPQWGIRADVKSSLRGDYGWRTILRGGAGGRHGLGGVVGLMRGGAGVTARALDVAGQPVGLRRVEVWHQAGQGYGTLTVSLDGVEQHRQPAVALQTEDRVLEWTPEAPVGEVRVGAVGGVVPLYGLVLETGNPGATWETQAVSGVGSRSFSLFAGEALAEQVSRRDPDLIVVMLGGNEAGYPTLTVNSGHGYTPIFREGLQTILAGKGDAACLVVTPLDQGYIEPPPEGSGEEVKGTPMSRKGMPNMVARQREVAKEAGCAFWSAWQAMGGEGSALVWGRTRGLGTGDYVHLSGRAHERIGDRLAEALLQAYDAR
jgi:lysophospholipase L1-like esterase